MGLHEILLGLARMRLGVHGADGPPRRAWSLGKGGGLLWSLPSPAQFWGTRGRGKAAALTFICFLQEAEPRMWTYVYPAKYSDIKTEDERWKEERDRKLKEERNRSKDVSKEDGKESTSSECKLTPTEEARMVGKDPRPSVHVPVSSPLTQHQSYIPYMHGYSYSQSYDPNHPSYRAMPTVMMQNYPGRGPRPSQGHLTLGGHPFPGCACVPPVLLEQGTAAGRSCGSLCGPGSGSNQGVGRGASAGVLVPLLLGCSPGCSHNLLAPVLDRAANPLCPHALTAFFPPRIVPSLQLFLLPVWEQGIRER